jgi:hypothetical protein
VTTKAICFSKEKYFTVDFVIAQALTVALTTEIWDGRFFWGHCCRLCFCFPHMVLHPFSNILAQILNFRDIAYST